MTIAETLYIVTNVSYLSGYLIWQSLNTQSKVTCRIETTVRHPMTHARMAQNLGDWVIKGSTRVTIIKLVGNIPTATSLTARLKIVTFSNGGLFAPAVIMSLMSKALLNTIHIDAMILKMNMPTLGMVGTRVMLYVSFMASRGVLT